MLQLLINHQPADLSGNEEIAADYAMFDVKDMGSRKGTRSYTFKLPLTANNKRLFEIPTQLHNLSTMPYRRIHARALKDGIDLGIRFAEIEEISDEMEVRLYGGNSDFFELIKDKNLRDVNLRQYNHFRTHDLIAQSRFNNSGYIYPIINYYNEAEGSIAFNSNRIMDVDDMYPAVFADTLLQQMCADAGYTLQNDMLNDEHYTANALLIPFSHTEFKRNYDGSRYLMTIMPTSDTGISDFYFDPSGFFQAGQIGNNVYNAPLPATVAPSNSVNWYLSSVADNYFTAADTSKYNGSIKFADEVRVGIRYKFIINSTLPANATIFVYFEDGHGYYAKQFVIQNGINLIEDTFEIDVRGALLGLRPELRWNFMPGTSNDYFILGANSEIEIYKCTILSNGIITNISTYHPQTYNYVTLSSALPDMKQSDFLKSYCTMYGLLASVDETYKVLKLFRYDTILKNVTNAYNWGDKLDLTDDASITFSKNNAPKVTNFNYKEVKDVPAPPGTAGSIEIQNTLSDDTKEVNVAFQYTATRTGLKNLDIPQIALYKDGVLGIKQSPRVLLLKRYHATDFADTTPIRIRGYILYTEYTDNIPLPYFIRQGQSYNLGFGNNLLGLYYSTLADILNNLKALKLEVRLNAADINQLDFTRPVYLPQYSSYFYINKIQGYKYVQNDSTMVELVKLNIL